MRMLARGVLAAGIVAAGATAFGLGYGGSFNDINGSISEAVDMGDPSAVKIQKAIAKESDRLSKDFVTFARVAREAEKNGFTLLSEGFLDQEFNDMVVRSETFGADAFLRLATAVSAEPDPRKAARILKKQLRYAARQSKSSVKYESALASGDRDRAAIYYASIQKLFEAIDRAFPGPV